MWTGRAAEAARGHCYRVRAGMHEHADEPENIGKAMQQAAEEIDTCQKQLNRVIAEIEGRGNSDSTRNAADDWKVKDKDDGNYLVKHPSEKEAEAQSYVNEIDGIIDKADQAQRDGADKIQAAAKKLTSLQKYLAEERREEREEGRQAANKLQWYLQHDKEPPAWLRKQVAENADDEYFAGSFGNTLGASGILNIPAQVAHCGLGDEERNALMAAIGETVGTATNGEGPDLKTKQQQALIDAAGSTETKNVDGLQYREFWAMQQLLANGEGHLEGWFLAETSAEIFRNRHELEEAAGTLQGDEYGVVQAGTEEGSLTYVSTEPPMTTALKALDDSPEAGRRFFGHTDENGEYNRIRELVNENYGNAAHGAALTEAVKAAATEFPTFDPDRDTDAHKQASEVAGAFLHQVAAEERGGFLGIGAEEGSPAAKRDVAGIMSFYYEDLNRALTAGEDYDPDPGSHNSPLKYSVTGFKYGVTIPTEDAKTLLDSVWEDEKAQGKLVNAAAVYARENIQYKMDHWYSDEEDYNFANRVDARNAGYKDYGTSLGALVSAAHANDIEGASTEDLMKKVGKSTITVGLTAAGPAGAAGRMGLAALGEIAKGSLDQVGGAPGSARDALAQEVNSYEASSRFTVTEMMIQRGDWPQSDVPDEYWNEQKEQLEVPEDPEEYANFKIWLAQHTDGYIQQAHANYLDGLEVGSSQYA